MPRGVCPSQQHSLGHIGRPASLSEALEIPTAVDLAAGRAGKHALAHC
ncbi:hypothetical protein Nmel_011142 [Mimus melanotis]